MQSELTLISEAVMGDLAELDEDIRKEKEDHQARAAKKEAEIGDVLNAMRELQRELLRERERANAEAKSMREKFEAAARASETRAAETAGDLEKEKLRFISEKDELHREQDRLQADLDEKSGRLKD